MFWLVLYYRWVFLVGVIGLVGCFEIGEDLVDWFDIVGLVEHVLEEWVWGFGDGCCFEVGW